MRKIGGTLKSQSTKGKRDYVPSAAGRSRKRDVFRNGCVIAETARAGR